MKASVFYPYLHLCKQEELASVLIKTSLLGMCQVALKLLSDSAIHLMQCHFLSLLNFTEDFKITTTEQEIIIVPAVEI